MVTDEAGKIGGCKVAEILVVDDNPGMVGLVIKVLNDSGYTAVGAESGREALEILKQKKPDLILLDVMMPRLDGWQTLKLIRKEPDLKNVPIAMLTVKKLTHETILSNEIGEIVDYIQKPFTKDSLLNRVNQLINESDEISAEKTKLRAAACDENLIDHFERTHRAEKLHKKILGMLRQSLENMGSPDEVAALEKAIEIQEQKIEWIKVQGWTLKKDIRNIYSLMDKKP